MSSNVDVPYTRRNVSALSQRSNNNSNARTPRPINESMVRERLSVNLPNSFHYLSSTLPMGRHRSRHHRHRHHSSGSSSSSSSSSSGRNSRTSSAHNSHASHERRTARNSLNSSMRNPPVNVAASDTRAAERSGRGRLASPPSTPHSRTSRTRSGRSSSSSSSSSTSSSSSGSDDSSAHRDTEDDYTFYARLVKLDRSDQPHHSPTAGGPGAPPGGAAPLVAQCCDTVRGTLDLLDQVRFSTASPEDRDKFFWLDLHGVPPPLPGTEEWGLRPRRWQRRQHAALRRATQASAQSTYQNNTGSGRLPEVEMTALWTALGLQSRTARQLMAVCQQRQRNPRPDRTSLDDVYEEEMVDLTCPDDRVLQVEPLSVLTDAAPSANAEPVSPAVPREIQESRQHAQGNEERTKNCETENGSVATAAQPLVAPASFAARLGATHYVLMELATLLTCVPATTTNISAGTWSSTYLSHVGSYDFANEPLNDAVWTETMGRSMHTVPAGYRAAAAARRGVYGATSDGRASRQVTQSSAYQTELPVTPLITATYVICFPGGCVTWCPASTLGLTSAARRERRIAEAGQRQQRRRRHRQRRRDQRDDNTANNINNNNNNNYNMDRNAPPQSDTTSTTSTDSDIDEGLEVQYVKSWEQLQASVFHRLRHMAARKDLHTATVACGSGSRNNNNNIYNSMNINSGAAFAAAPALSTSGFVSLLLSAVCYAYLPNTTSVLGEVDAIDSMLPLVGLNVESDQADALRRVLLLRRRLAVHRRLLFQKTRLLEALDRPAMHTIARFVRTVKAPSWVTRAGVYNGSSSRLAWGGGGESHYTISSSGVHASEVPRRDSDTDSLSGAPTPRPYDHAAGRTASGEGPNASAMPIVHFVDTGNEEAPWSLRTAEENYGGASKNGDVSRHRHSSESSKEVSATCFPNTSAADNNNNNSGGGRGARRTNQRSLYGARRAQAYMAEPPSLNAIHKGISNVLRNLEVARTVLGNTTLIYSSTVNYNNSRSSESADYFALICQYMLLIVLPLNIIASQWGMNCMVPFHTTPGTKPFWSIVGIMIFLGVAGLAVPFYAYRAGRLDMIS